MPAGTPEAPGVERPLAGVVDDIASRIDRLAGTSQPYVQALVAIDGPGVPRVALRSLPSDLILPEVMTAHR